MTTPRTTRILAACALLTVAAVLAACTPSANKAEQITAGYAFVKAGHTNQVASCAEAAKTVTLGPGRTQHVTRCTHVNGAGTTLVSTYVNNFATVTTSLYHRRTGELVKHTCNFDKYGNEWVFTNESCRVGA